MTIYTDKDAAWETMRVHNQVTVKARDFFVLVDGPDDGQYTVMTLHDAQLHGFAYSITW